jgi:NADPH:quinone reductase-like Zn-dependent oxidoreductase
MTTTTKEPQRTHAAESGETITIAAHSTTKERMGQSMTMQAIVQDQYGSADVLQLQEVDKPTIGDGDVLVRVHAAGVHVGDWHLMTGRPYLMRIIGFGFRAPKARVRGMDVAGVVEAVGKHVTRFQAGDAVFGTCDGSFAEYACAREDMLMPKPAHLTFEQAAAVPTSAYTALQALRDAGKIQPAQKVLIVGVQIAKSFGAEVTGVCSTTKMHIVRSIGADRVIDYTQEDFTQSGQQYDLILDMAGNRSLSQIRRALTPHGTLVLVGGEAGGQWIGAVSRSLQALLVSPFVRHKLRPLASKPRKEDLQILTDLIKATKVMPVIDRTYPLREVPDAIRYVHTGQARGKIIITV